MDKQAIKVLFFGVFSEDSTNISQANAFEKNGCQVTRHDFRKYPILLEDTGFDLIFYSKCNELGIDAVQKYKGIKCLWYMDPLNGNYDIPFEEKLIKVDFACFALYDPYIRSKSIYGKDTLCYLIEEGFDPDMDYPVEDEEIINHIGFIGTLYNESRKKYHEKIGFDLLKCSREQHRYVVAQTKFNLNFCDGGTSDRAYKIMAAGGLLLSEPWPECPFKDGEDFISFLSVEDLIEKARYYDSNIIERILIKQRGKLVVQKYSRTNWAKRILDIYKQCK